MSCFFNSSHIFITIVLCPFLKLVDLKDKLHLHKITKATPTKTNDFNSWLTIVRDNSYNYFNSKITLNILTAKRWPFAL